MTNEIKKIEEKNITDAVQNRIFEMQANKSIDLPNNYSLGNALKSAYLILQETQTRDKKPVLEACTPASITNALLDMAVQGLNPGKGQCYFIPYGNQLNMSRSYLGTIAITKRIKGVKDVKGYAVYKDDTFKLGFDVLTGETKVEEYVPGLDRNPSKLIGAFAVIIGETEILHTEYMDINQIKSAWNQGQMKGASGAHKNFADQMAIKTVINRACKLYANTSDDADSVSMLMNKTDDEVQVEIEENANKIELEDNTVVDAEPGEVIEEPTTAPF